MKNALRQKVTVQPGGVIEIRSPELVPGTVAEVIVISEFPSRGGRPFSQLIGAGKGGFPSAVEADAFIRDERDAWDS